MTVGGLHSFYGTVELRGEPDGLTVVNRLSLERYLLGLQEVPLDWPGEALRAQAVAARTYALWTLAAPRAGQAAARDFDICASIQCQVFSGADVLSENLLGFRWTEAVGSTRGEAVLYDGQPILARYHSTSGGRTLDNEQAFPTEPAYPYLKGVTSTTETAAPLYRWTVDMELAEVEAMMRRAGHWAGGSHITAIKSARSRAGLHYPDLVFTSGRRVGLRMTAEEFRIIVRELAPQMFPARFPSAGPTSSGRLPETLPSNRIEASSDRRIVRIQGRGWGHGSGMSQWGAHGLALEGLGYVDILRHYYTGVEVGPVETHRPIDVGVAWARPEVQVSGAFAVKDGRGNVIAERAKGTWSFQSSDPGTIAVRGTGAKLQLSVGLVEAPDFAMAGEASRLKIVLSKAAKVVVRPRPRGGEAVEPQRVRSGSRTIRFDVPTQPGRYEVEVQAKAKGERASASFPLVVAGATANAPQEDEAPATGPRRSWLWSIAIVVVLALLIGALAVTMTG